MHTDLEGTVALLDEAGMVGVWGNHDFGLCRDNPTAEDRLRYSERLLEFMGRLRPRLEVQGCLFTHVEPWLDPEKVEDMWFFEGPPENPRAARPDLLGGPAPGHVRGTLPPLAPGDARGHPTWSGDGPIVLEAGNRYFVAVHAVCQGGCALFDTATGLLTPFDKV